MLTLRCVIKWNLRIVLRFLEICNFYFGLSNINNYVFFLCYNCVSQPIDSFGAFFKQSN